MMLVRRVARWPGKQCVFLGKREDLGLKELELGIRPPWRKKFCTFSQIFFSLFGRVGLYPTLWRDRNFWSLKPPGDCSWTWRKILKLRSSVRDNFMLSGGRVTWIRSKNGVFTTKSAWDFFREKGSPAPGIRLSGSPGLFLVMPWSFGWLLEVDWILLTDWPPLVFPNPSLVLCATGKTRVWITFSSLASYLIWHSLFNKCNLPCTFSCWEDFFQGVANRVKGKSLRDLIIKLMMAAGVYIV